MVKFKPILVLGLLGGCFCLTSGIISAEDALDNVKDPVTIPLGGFDLSPVLEVGETFNDNIFLRNTAKQSSFVTQVHAGAQLALKRHLDRYALTYALQSSHYHSSPQDDYVDHYVGFNSHNEFTSRNRLDTELSYFDSHYMRGRFLGRDLTDASLSITEPDQYQLYTANALYRYGQDGAKGNIELKIGLQDYTFLNNRLFTLAQDRYAINSGIAFLYRAFPKTTLRLAYDNTLINYKQVEGELSDNTSNLYTLGGVWAHSSQLNFGFNVGYQQVSYNKSLVSSGGSGVNWNMNVGWNPLSYSTVSFAAGQGVAPSINGGVVRSYDRYNLGWNHQWNGHISTQINMAYENANYSTLQRQDDFLSSGIDLNYGVKRWLGLGVNYTYRKLDSGDDRLNFDQNTLMFYVTGNPRLSDEVKNPWGNWY